MISYAKTDTGIVRRSNQDFLFASDQPVGPLPNLFIVADGMGGHKAGDFASRYVVEHMKENIENSDAVSPVMVLRKALEKTNLGLYEESMEDPEREGMGSTLVAATIEDDRTADSTFCGTAWPRSRGITPLWRRWSREGRWSGTVNPTGTRRISSRAL